MLLLIFRADVSGLTIQGITFTGTLYDLPFGLLLSGGIIISAPGFGVTFDDCHFVDLSATAVFSSKRLENIVPPNFYPADSGSITVKNSYFKNVNYQRQVFTSYGNSILQIENCVFEKVTVNPRPDPNDYFAGVFFICRASNLCSVKNSCMTDIKWDRALFYRNDYNATQDGTNLTEQEGAKFEFANNFGTNYINPVGYAATQRCDLGFGIGDVLTNPTRIIETDCESPPGFDAATCPSDANTREVCLYPFWSTVLPFLFPC